MRTTFTVPGKPRGKGRPRFVNGRAYTDQRTYEYEQTIKLHYINATTAKNRMHYGALIVTIQADFAPPKSWANAKRANAIAGKVQHTSKPDLDNIIKSLDALNGIAWYDDSQIVGIIARKRFSENDCLTITIEEADNGNN